MMTYRCERTGEEIMSNVVIRPSLFPDNRWLLIDTGFSPSTLPNPNNITFRFHNPGEINLVEEENEDDEYWDEEEEENDEDW